MKKKIILIPVFLLTVLFTAFGQPPGRSANPAAGPRARIYGKVVDELGGGVGYATVQLMGKQLDPTTGSARDTLLAGQLTEDNGDFNIEGVPVTSELTLIISYLGYAEHQQSVDLGIPKPGAGAGPPSPAGGFARMGALEKDLGNIQLSAESTVLQEVTVTGKAPIAALTLDRKTFRVDRDLTASGGTAEDALKNVPSLSVDLDGNVSLRNGSPQILIDGKQTTLSLNQISADLIESVEVITNPSAKYDAGGGAAGIVNIVLKKDKRVGYNGNLRAGVDSRAGFNLGGDLNARGEKINVFGSAMLMSRQGQGESETYRESFYEDPVTKTSQLADMNMRGLFGNARAGIDYFVDNRNTLTLSGSYVRGQFNPTETMTNLTDFLYPDETTRTSYVRQAEQERNFRNFGLTAQFKHLFPKEGSEWTADVNYNQVRFEGGGEFLTQFESGDQQRQRQDILGQGSFFTLQTDFVTLLGKSTKLEGGLKAILRDNRNDNLTSVYDDQDGSWQEIDQMSNQFSFNDNVFAAYLQAGQTFGQWGLQAGLRAESSFYTGNLIDQDSSFTINYPISLFPSVFLTRQLNETDQIQLAYTRRVNRPNFFQTMPFTDFSDSLNLRRGNPQLRPEFTNSLELSYQKIFKSGDNLLFSVYYKHANNLITSYQFTEFNPTLGKEVVITSFANSEQAWASGAEITLRNSLFSWLDLTSNLNVFYSDVDASNVESDLTASRWSGFLKETVQVELPAGFSFQLNGEVRTRASFNPVSDGGGFRSSQNSAQGYSKPYWFVDASLRKALLDNKASLTLSMQDVFGTRVHGSYTEAEFFTQETSRLMNPQLFRLNFSYRFGKMDSSLFRRKNNNVNMQGNDMMGG